MGCTKTNDRLQRNGVDFAAPDLPRGQERTED